MTRAFWFVAAIYGAEAASQRYFQVPAAELSERQAILLAAVIVNPRRYSPLTPSRRIEKRAHMIASRLRRRGFLSQEQYLAAIGSAPAAPEKRSLADWFFGTRPESAAAAPDSGTAGEPQQP